MPSIVNVDGEQIEVSQGGRWDDRTIDQTIGRLVVALRDQGVAVPRIASRFRVHRATVYRWIAQVPDCERERLRIN